MINMDTATFTQDQDTAGCSDGTMQYLGISRVDAGDGDYFVITTERWAFDDIDELVATIKRFTEGNDV